MSNIRQMDPTNHDFAIQFHNDLNWKMDEFHFHDMYEIYLSLSDKAYFFVGDVIYNISAGSLFVFNDLDLHKSISLESQPFQRYVLHFNPNYVNDMSTSRTNLLSCFSNRSEPFNHSIQLSTRQMERYMSMLKKNLAYSEENIYGQDVYRKLSLVEILLFVNELFRTSTVNLPSRRNKDFEKIQPIINYIHSNLDQNLSLGQIADHFYINKYYLETIFKKATGYCVIEYLIDCRINKARELLKQKMAVQLVAGKVGFNNYSHFIRTFKKKVGLPPKKYANQF